MKNGTPNFERDTSLNGDLIVMFFITAMLLRGAMGVFV